MRLDRVFFPWIVLIAACGFAAAQAPEPASKPAAKPPAAAKTAPAAEPAEAALPKGADKAATPLGVRQQRVNAMVQQLQAKFEELAKSKAVEPEQAKRLVNALVESQKSRLPDRMADLVKLLDDLKLTGARAEQDIVIADIKRLIAILTDDEDEREKERQRLEKWKQDVKQLIKEELVHKRESDKVSEKDKTLAELELQIKALEDLIKREEKIVDDTAKARTEGGSKLGRIADDQAKTRGDTERLAKAVAGPEEEPTKSEGQPGEGSGKEDTGKEGSGKEGAGKEGSGKEGSGKEGSGKEGSGKEGSGKEGSGKEGSGKEGGGKEGGASGKDGGASGKEGGQSGGKPGGKSGGQEGGNQPGEKPLRRAVGQQQKAEDNLGQGKAKTAEQNERQAVKELQDALKEIKGEKARIASLPKEAFEKMAQGQDRTADKTDQLNKDMKQASKDGGQGGQGGEGGEGGEGKQQPGQQKVQQAQQEMQGASGKLRKQEPKQATRNQADAVKNLKDALDEIERRLAQLRQEMQAERLAALEAHFRRMLEMQQPVTIATKSLDRIRLQRPWSRQERLQVGKMAQQERELAVLAQQGLDILMEDGTSVVFPRVVEQLRDDLVSVSKLIDGQKTGAYTQALQREIESTLKELIEALVEAQKQSEPSDSPPGESSAPPEEPPLLPTSAELKLLRSAQLRVNRRTKSFDDVRPASELDAVLREEVVKIARHQEKVETMTRAMIERPQ